MKEFITSIKKDLVSESFQTRSSSNLALLAYDLGRAKSEFERNNARDEYNFRNMAFVCRSGLKEALRWSRK